MEWGFEVGFLMLHVLKNIGHHPVPVGIFLFITVLRVRYRGWVAFTGPRDQNTTHLFPSLVVLRDLLRPVLLVVGGSN